MTGLLSGVRQAIGQYFSLVSLLPSVLLVAYCFVLFSSGALSGPPDLGTVRAALSGLDFGEAALLALVAMVVGVVTHPLQFMIVQWAEGYWGLGNLSRRMRELAVDRHRRRRDAVVNLAKDAAELRELIDDADDPPEDRVQQRLLTLHYEASRLSASYPGADDDVMPTRLGNVLRRYEVGAGEPFGLPATALLPLVALVAPANELTYLNDRRSAMDLSVRTAANFGIAFLLTVVFLWDDGLWLLAALVPYTLSYLSYRGAVVQAHDYGNAMANVIAMNRFTLYERLRLHLPDNVLEERRLHERLQPMHDLTPLQKLAFKHPPGNQPVAVPGVDQPPAG
jgi:hypothetical protein